MILRDLAAGWLRVGVFGFGGGPSLIPLIRQECVERYHWMDDAQLLDAVAFGNTLPGPIAVKLAAYIGHQQAGWLGASVALLAMSLPGIAMMIALGLLWARFKSHPVVAGMMAGARPAVVAMLAYTVVVLAPDGVRDARALAIGVVALGALWLKVHPGLVMVGAMAVGALLLRGGAA